MEAARRLISSRVAVIVLATAAAAGAPSALACGISLSGTGPNLTPSSVDASFDAASIGSNPSGADGDVTIGDDASEADGGEDGSSPDATSDSTPGPDSDAGGGDGSHLCAPIDAGLTGALDLSTFTFVGSASFNENGDARITLTNSETSQAGAAWYPAAMPNVNGYDLTWSLRVGAGDISGDGITFAVLSSTGALGVGDNGDGIGLRNITQSGGSGGGPPPAGYAVVVDMFKDPNDPTDLGPTTLKLVTMPGFAVIAETPVQVALNDGNTYAVDVSWRAPSSITATLHAPGGVLVNVTSANPGLTAPGGHFGFTASTGGSDSHNEVAGITVTGTCE